AYRNHYRLRSYSVAHQSLKVVDFHSTLILRTRLAAPYSAAHRVGKSDLNSSLPAFCANCTFEQSLLQPLSSPKLLGGTSIPESGRFPFNPKFVEHGMPWLTRCSSRYMSSKRKPNYSIGEGESSSTPKSQGPWFRRAIQSPSKRKINTKTINEGLQAFRDSLHTTDKDICAVFRRKKWFKLSRKRGNHVPPYIVAELDRMLQRLRAKRARMLRKINMRENLIQIQQKGFPSVECFDLGAPSCLCHHCGAIMWLQESTYVTQNSMQPSFQLCCNAGGVTIPPLREPPNFLKSLIQSGCQNSQHFHKNIRAYNGVFCFTSMGGKVNHKLNSGSAPYIYSIGGQIFHRIGSLLPPEGQAPSFLQLYIHDSDNEIMNRLNSISKDTKLRESILQELRNMLDEHNALVKVFRFARDRMDAVNVGTVKLQLLAARSSDGREYDLPTVDELGQLIVDETGGASYQPNIVVEHQSSKLQRISPYHPSIMALQYLLLFPYGEDGWHANISVQQPTYTLKTVSQCDFYAYRLQTRFQESSHLLLSRRLFQQYVVNAYAFVEAERLYWIKNNQVKLRYHYFQGLADAFTRGDTNMENTGKHVILAASHTSSPRCKYENFQDAMAICRVIGYPDLFITFTCNSDWPEIHIMVNLVRHTEGKDPNRADVIARVFKLKLNQLILEINTKMIFGKPTTFVQAIEFQKRGLPHAHMLLFLSAEDKIHDAASIDVVISAEIPDPIIDPLCYKAVEKFMFHGPCGAAFPNAPCITENKCTKHFPKSFCPQTCIDEDGFPRYRRFENDRVIVKSNVELDNRFVVPYNRYLLLRFNAHINVEFCNKSRAIKYLFKYINKPPDRAKAVVIGNNPPQSTSSAQPSSEAACNIDEIHAFMDCRHITPGCGSFEDIKTVNGIVHESFKDACQAYGFLADDGEWNQCLQEGDDIWAEIPVSLLDRFTHLMVEQKSYTIHQLNVIAAPEEYRPTSNKFVIQFLALTTVEEIPDIPSIPYYKFTFITETELRAGCETENPTVLLGDVLCTLCELYQFVAMMDEVLAANGDKSLVLIATSVYIRLRNGNPVLYASSATQLCRNLQIPEVLHFFNWYASEVTAPVLINPSDITKTPVVTIEEMNALIKESNNQNNYYIVECTIKGVKNGWCYFGCSNCPKKVEEGVDEYFCCRSV
ncbi:hypothetical protein LINPERHAP2_LOCUS37497, partial [Linum perenne]